MAATIANPFIAVYPPFTRRRLTPLAEILGPNRKLVTRSALSTSSDQKSDSGSLSPVRTSGSAIEEVNRFNPAIDEGDCGISESVNGYFQEAAVLVKSTGDGGGPRWFSPVECGRPCLKGAPLLLYLPGIDGVGLGLVRQHQRLGRIFEIWCLHIPVMDRTPFSEMVKLVEGVVRSEHSSSPQRPIYLVGESLGSCLALAVASRNPDIDLVLILSNPATSFNRSPLQLLSTLQLQLLVSLLEVMLSQPFPDIPFGYPLRGDTLGVLADTVERALGQSQVADDLLQGLRSLSLYYSVVADILPINTLLWKMEMLKNASAHANSSLNAIKAQTLILTSGRDPLFPSQEEGERLRNLIPNCEIRKFNDKGHFLFLEDGVDLVYTVKGATFYRRKRSHDYVADYLPPSPSDFKIVEDDYRLYTSATSPVVLSTLDNGMIVRGLAGFPSEGPTLLVGYHMLLGLELAPLSIQILAEKNIVVRGMAHPMMFYRSKKGKLPDLSEFDMFRLMGAIPVSGTNLFKLLASKSHVLLYPGGMREALHRKGEEYQLFWPEQSEFVRMAARFGAKIVPFGVVGEDDIAQLVLDYNDLVKIPYFKGEIEELTNEAVRLRTDSSGEVMNQQAHLPGILPKVPGRLYYLFGKPIETEEKKQELKDREKAHELYLEVKSEVERCLAYLKEKREHDPYRSIMSRLLYQSTHGFTSEIPTFKL